MSTRGIAISMMFAHWLYWSAALSPYLVTIYNLLTGKPIDGSYDLSSKSRSAESLREIAREGMDLSAFKTLVKKKALPFDDEMVEQLFEAADEDSSGIIDDKEIDKLVKQMNILAAGIFKSMKKSQGESVFEVAKPAATTATPLPSPREGTKSVTIKVDQL
eukprot:CAMPEP_0181248478 /NCGR_PEP_ID=MMETSP1096-20121128/45189_1 /TAXON_ID=156174 ORGANISM="Chrysochromulina ericina, Strain CCMP281" /NCGR_SAMPLE_ID=MMETSP1096 /ASSEMBLY_ACC=CAM_ASM_000453 /LENGTH=160 /DNA_ID=CAMNT_0023345645 /DNA_START=461 /DNA_END=943 /DNA_ORIENTATION=+